MIKKCTRKQFVSWLIKEARKDKRIFLLTGDLGFGFLHPFAEEFPDRFVNCGVIEQSMVGIACGLAIMGKKPYVYSNATFLIFRALEQIRNDIIHQELDVTLVGTVAPQYNLLGYTHLIQNDEDIKILEALGGKIKYIRLL